jgi:hypothetical protein
MLLESLDLPLIAILSKDQVTEIADAIAVIKIVPTILSSHLPPSKDLFRNPSLLLATLCPLTPC